MVPANLACLASRLPILTISDLQTRIARHRVKIWTCGYRQNHTQPNRCNIIKGLPFTVNKWAHFLRKTKDFCLYCIDCDSDKKILFINLLQKSSYNTNLMNFLRFHIIHHYEHLKLYNIATYVLHYSWVRCDFDGIRGFLS